MNGIGSTPTVARAVGLYRPRHARRAVRFAKRQRPVWRLALFTLAVGSLLGAASSAALLATNPGGLLR